MKEFIDIILVFVGGGIGALARHAIRTNLKFQGEWLGTSLWVINTLGCFIIGILAGWLMNSSLSTSAKHTVFLLTMVGFCGGFTAFSSFSLDCIEYFNQGKIGAAFVYVLITFLAALCSTFVGFWAGSKI